MGKEVFPGRYTTEQEENVVVFLIGMRINKWWAIHKWLPVFTAMPPMIRELYMNKKTGFLSMESFFSLRTTLLVQYWRSSDDLITYAKGPTHLTAWRRFNKKIGNNNAVGIYHETYVIEKGNYESVYGNMPVFGLAKAAGHRLISTPLNSARKRLKTGN
ncbi:DUF4188 domain-containing protein [Virgibacillus byunsanensis]|uniref:DUF4188 domain-containing protein n=1 Tax=Virgibacillus byunsanensis TaxID=570945 RepID=A0ABW3LK74_9BACI